MLCAQPLEDALGRVALLVVAVAVLLEHLADEGLVGIELARALRGLRAFGARSRLPEHLFLIVGYDTPRVSFTSVGV